MIEKRIFSLVTASLAALALSASAVGAQGTLNVLATTTLVADVARNVGGDRVTVSSLLGADTDTHAYEPTTDDALRIAQADLLLTVGAGYEGFLGGLLENAGADIPVVMVSKGVEILPLRAHGHDEDELTDADTDEHAGEIAPLGVLGVDLDCAPHEADTHDAESEHQDEHVHGECDPHVWMDPRNVAIWAGNIAEALAAADPEHADEYHANAEAYRARLEALHTEIEDILSVIPEARRVLVTNHEFMGYFARAYDFEIAATVLPSGTTGGELDPQTLAELITLVRDENVPAIFAEISANPRLAEVIAQEAGIAVVTSLYSEALSTADGPAATYVDYMLYNAETIAGALTAGL